MTRLSTGLSSDTMKERRAWLRRLANRGCPVCGSRRAACSTLAAATGTAGQWCPSLEDAIDKAPPRQLRAGRRA
jgi:hypothetical protein